MKKQRNRRTTPAPCSAWIVPPPLKLRSPWQKLWRLPHHLKPVFGVVLNIETGQRTIWIVGFDEAAQRFVKDCWEEMGLNLVVTHWMPSPKLPKKFMEGLR